MLVMRAAGLFLFFLPGAAAAAPEDAYYAARDAAVARVNKLDSNAKDYSAALDKETGALAALLRPLIGRVDVKGFPGPGRLNWEYEGQSSAGFGPLDGLKFGSANGKNDLVVTTEPIFRHWLADHKDFWRKGETDAGAVLRSEPFYTQAFETDAAFILYGELPVSTPKGLSVALLAANTQDDPPPAPDQIVVAVISNGRALIAHADLSVKITPAAACNKARAAAQARIDAANDAFIATKRKDAALGEKVAKLESDAEGAFRSCFQAQAQAQPGFAVARIQAQALVDAMAEK